MDKQRLEEISLRAEKATPGPWEIEKRSIFYHKAKNYVHIVLGPEYMNANELDLTKAIETYCPPEPVDMQFIAAARQDIPDLLAYIEELRAALYKIGDDHAFAAHFLATHNHDWHQFYNACQDIARAALEEK